MPDSKLPNVNSLRETTAAAAARAQPIKACGKCNTFAEPLGGVQMRDKWYCAKCWIKFLGRK